MFQKIKDLIKLLWVEKDKNKARDIAINLSNKLLLVMGAPEAKIKNLKDIYNSALPPSYFSNQKIESWFEKHPFFNGPLALKLYDDKSSPFESSFFHLSDTATKARIAATTLLGINWEDLEIYELPKYKVGIDFFLNFDSNSLLMVVSKRGNVRVIEFSERLTHTQVEILAKLSESKGLLAFDGIDIKTGVRIPREPQKTIHELLWRELQVNEVNKKFYVGIADHFDQLTKYLLDSKQFKDKKDAQLFSSRLIGRLLFIWFLRKMDLINDDIQYFNLENKLSTDYYESKLKPLFFEVLNTPKEERKFKDFKTPFLNGGLFEAHPNDCYDLKVAFPEHFFTSLYNHLYSFNFTVDESTPEYEQVAIDPEMLGRVFENLLASIVPETSGAANDRNNKGAFYTPRDVVSFMCKESLKELIKSKLNDESLDDGITKLIDFNDANFLELKSTGLANLWGVRSKDIVPKTIEILNDISIFDPACGSGAFPIGMLQLITRTFERLNAKYDNNLKKHIYSVGKSFINRYETKLFIIRNNLYGSDIEPMAIEISRLRCWLSIIVEEKSNVQPLPNLEFNFICSNSLVKLQDDVDIFEDQFIEGFKELRNEYFDIHSKKRKIDLRKDFEKLYANHFLEKGLTSKANKLKTWNPFDISKPADFFDVEIMFNIKEFDILIANPPYIHLESIREISKNIYQPLNYKTYEARGDIYTLFYELGIELLKNKGILCFITSNKWLRADYGRNLRNYLLDYTQPILLLDLGSGVFESATVDTNILLSKKSNYSNPIKTKKIDKSTLREKLFQITNSTVEVKFQKDDQWLILDKLQYQIMKKLSKYGHKITTIDNIKINRGIITGLNEVFIIDGETRKKIINESKNKEEKELCEKLIQPILRGRDFTDSSYNWNGDYIILAYFGSHKWLESKANPIFKYLFKHKEKLEKRAQCRYLPSGITRRKNGNNESSFDGMHHWLELDNCPTLDFVESFYQPKIYWSDISNEVNFIEVKEKFFINNTAYMITGAPDWLFQYLNSNLVKWYLKTIATDLGSGGFRLFKQFVELIPVPKDYNQDQFKSFNLNEDEINFILNFSSKTHG